MITDITESKQSEQLLYEVTEFQKAILDNASYAIIATTPVGLIKVFNPAAERMLGYSASEMIDMMTPAILHEVNEVIERAKIFSEELGISIEPGFEVFVAKARYNLTNEYEWTYIRKDGSRLPVLLSVTALHNAMGEISGFLGMANDITERKAREIEIEENEERFRAIFDGSNDAVMLLNEKGFFDCNPSTLEIFGIGSKEDFIKYHPSELSPPTQPDGRNSFDASMEKIQTAYIQGMNRFEWIHRRSNGEDFPAEVLLSAFKIKGETVLQATVRDITERKAREREIEESKERFINVINRSLVGIFNTNEKGLVQLANPSLLKILEFNTLDELNQKGLLNLYVNPDDRKKLWEQVKIKPVTDFETRFYTANGKIIYVSISAFLVKVDNAEYSYLEGTLEDITVRYNIQEELRKAQETADKIIDSIPIQSAVTRLSDGKIFRANKALQEFHQVEMKVFETMKTMDWYVNAEERKNVLSKFGEQGFVTDYEIKFKRFNNGEIRDCLLSFVPINYHNDECIVLSIIDVTDIKKIQQELQKKLDELERFNRLVVGRELRMIELKKEINEMLERDGELKKYKIADDKGIHEEQYSI